MSYCVSTATPPSGPPDTFCSLLPRGGTVLVVAGGHEAQLQIGHSVAARQQRRLPAGSTLLVSAGSRPVHLCGTGCQPHPAGAELSRLLAFHDHAMGLQRALPDDRHLPAVLATAHDLRDAGTARHWLMAQLLGHDDRFRLVASVWARREPYLLVRFVLEHPDFGVQQLADRYGLSVAQFRRIGRKAFGRSLKEQLRLLRAGRVLHRYADTGHTFTRLSSDFGFSSPSHFCSEIKSLLGRSPRCIYQSVHLS